MRVWGSDLSPSAKLVLLALIDEGGDEVCLSQLEISEKTGLHRNTLRPIMLQLEEGGWIEPVGFVKSNVKCYRMR